jgi:hypothetical protein
MFSSPLLQTFPNSSHKPIPRMLNHIVSLSEQWLHSWNQFSVLVSFWSHLSFLPWERIKRRNGLFWLTVLEILVHHCREGMVEQSSLPTGGQEWEREIEREREAEKANRFSSSSPSISYRYPAYFMVPPTFRAGPSPLVNLLWKCPHR